MPEYRIQLNGDMVEYRSFINFCDDVAYYVKKELYDFEWVDISDSWVEVKLTRPLGATLQLGEQDNE